MYIGEMERVGGLSWLILTDLFYKHGKAVLPCFVLETKKMREAYIHHQKRVS